MANKIIFLLFNFFINNWLFIKFKSVKYKTIEYNYDFLNISFENFEELKKIFFSKSYFNNKYYDEKSLNYHSFGWINVAKRIGGAKNILLTKQHVFNWNKKKYITTSFVWNSLFIAKRILNLIYNYDFYAISASENEKILIKRIILKHYFILKLQMRLTKKTGDLSLEITKALLLFHLIVL